MHLGPDQLEKLFKAFGGGVEGEARAGLMVLDHILTCALCRRRLGVIVSELLSPPDAPANASEEPDPLFERVLQEIQLTLSSPPLLSDPRLDALFEKLLEAPPDVRSALIANDVRFAIRELARPLLSTARRSLPEAPQDAQHLASLVVTLTEGLEDTSKDRRFNAAAYCLLAEAQRLQGWFDIAEDFLRSAAYSLRDEPLVIPERVEFSIQTAHLRHDQKRIDEAVSMIEHSATLAEELGDFERLGRVRLSLGWMLLGEDDPSRAIPPLREALALLHEDPRHAFSALHGLLLAYAENGDDNQLSDTTRALEALIPVFSDPLDPLRVQWVIRRATWQRFERESSLWAMQELFVRLAELAPPHEIATAALELARTLAEANGEDSATALAGVQERVRTLPLPREFLSPILFSLDLAARRLGAFHDALISAASYVERARFNPDYPFWPSPEPESTKPWQEVPLEAIQNAANLMGIDLSRDLSQEDELLLGWALEAIDGIRPLGRFQGWTEDDTTKF